MDFNMSEDEKLNYHANTNGVASQAQIDREILVFLEKQLKLNGRLKESQIVMLYEIFLKSFKHSTYAIQEIKAFINGRRINKAECE